MRQSTAMRRLAMSVVRPSRRREAGYVARWTDPVSGKRRQKLLDCRLKREAYDAAGDLAEQIDSGMDSTGMSWQDFCRRYEAQAIGKQGAKSIEAWQTLKWFVEQHCPLVSIRSASNMWVDRFLDAFDQHRPEVSVNTKATYLARLRAALSWAVKKQYLQHLPYFDIEREAKPRSRAVTPLEFERMLVAIAAERPRDAHLWRRLLRGQFFTGLRISELLALSWDADADVVVIAKRRRPLIEIRKQKNKKEQVIPVCPAAWEIIAESPVRTGPVFPIPGRDGQMTAKAAVRIIAAIGAGIVTNKETGKTATSHDIRRAAFRYFADTFNEGLASKMLRHGDKRTSQTFYNTNEAEAAAELLWEGKD